MKSQRSTKSASSPGQDAQRTGQVPELASPEVARRRSGEVESGQRFVGQPIPESLRQELMGKMAASPKMQEQLAAPHRAGVGDLPLLWSARGRHHKAGP